MYSYEPYHIAYSLLILLSNDVLLLQTPVGIGPIAEYDYWNTRESALSLLMEQTKKTNFLKLMHTLSSVKSPIVDGFEFYRSELRKYYDQARNNVQFLATVLRYFKVSKFLVSSGKLVTKYYVDSDIFQRLPRNQGVPSIVDERFAHDLGIVYLL